MPASRYSDGCKTDCHVRAQPDELKEVPPVQRQFHDAPVLNHSADSGVVGDQQSCVGLHFNRFADLADLQLEIDAGGELHLQFNLIPDYALEAGLLRPDCIDSRWQ